MDGNVLPPEAEGGLSAVAETGQAEVPQQTADDLRELAQLYAEKARIETRIWHLIHRLCPLGAGS